MPPLTGRKHPYDFTLNAYPFNCYRPRGVPAWTINRVPDVAGQSGGSQTVPRHYRSGQSGFGWGQFIAENTYHYGISADLRYPGQFICGPLVYNMTLQGTGRTAVTGFFEKSSILYAIAGKWVNKITLNATPGSDAVAASGGWPYDLTTSNSGAVGTVGAEMDGNVVIGMTNASAANMVIFDGTNFTVMNGANVPKGVYLTSFYGDADEQLGLCFMSSGAPSAAWAAQGATLTTGANWTGYGGDYGVGNTSGTLTGLAAIERTLFIGMNDGLYYIDAQSERAPRLIKAIPRDSNNGVNMIADPAGLVWYPARAGLYLYDQANGTIDDVLPGRALPNRSGIIGLVTAITQFRGWTYVSVYDGTNSHIMTGRRREEGEPGYGPYIWHGALVKIASDKVTSMHVSSLVSPARLLFGLNSGDVKSIILPANGDNPLGDSTATFCASASIYFPADDFGIPSMYWQLSDVIIEAEGLGANTTVAVYERRDLGSWTQIGSTITASGRTVITPTTDKRFTRCELRLDLVNGDSSSTPVVRTCSAFALPRPTKRDIIQATVILDDEELSRQNIQSRYTAQALIDQLDTYDVGATYTLKHHWTGKEVSKTVIVLDCVKRLAKQEADKAAVYVGDLTLKIQA